MASDYVLTYLGYRTSPNSGRSESCRIDPPVVTLAMVPLWQLHRFSDDDERGPNPGVGLVVVLWIVQHLELRLPQCFSMRQPSILIVDLKQMGH